MKEVPAKDIMNAYNKMFANKITLSQVQYFLASNAFFNVPAEFAAKMMHDSLNKN